MYESTSSSLAGESVRGVSKNKNNLLYSAVPSCLANKWSKMERRAFAEANLIQENDR
eukprot:SAG31_NODE_3836_length_3834_cov_8.054886_2_plen_57_part_00